MPTLRPLLSVATTVLAFAYVGGLGGFAGLMLAAPHGNGIGLLIGVTICVVAYDVIGFFVGSELISLNDLMFDVKCTFISPLTHSSSPLRSFGVRAQSSASALLIFVSSVGGCGGFFFS